MRNRMWCGMINLLLRHMFDNYAVVGVTRLSFPSVVTISVHHIRYQLLTAHYKHRDPDSCLHEWEVGFNTHRLIEWWYVWSLVSCLVRWIIVGVLPLACQECKNDKYVPLTHRDRDKMAAISHTFSIAFSWMKMYEFRLRFHWILFLRFELTMFQPWSSTWRQTIFWVHDC